MVHGLVVQALLVQFLMVVVLMIWGLLIQMWLVWTLLVSGAVVGVIDQSNTDCINKDIVDTQTETKEAESSLEEEGEMLVDEDSFNDSKKRKVNRLLVK